MNRKGKPKRQATGAVSAWLAKRVKALRTARGMTAAQLAARCQAAGLPDMTAQAISNIETGRPDTDGRRRRYLTVDELLGLALALDVAPVHLLVGTTDDKPVPIAGDRVEPAAAVRAWVTGAQPLPGVDEVEFFARAPREDAVGVAELRRDVAELKRYVNLAGTGGPSAAKRAQLEAAMAEQEGEDG